MPDFCVQNGSVGIRIPDSKLILDIAKACGGIIAQTSANISGQENWRMFLFWLILWLGVIFVAFDPMIISQLISRSGDKNFTVGQIIGVGFIFTLFVVYRVYVKANRLEKQINVLVRKIALLELKKGKNK